MRTLTLQQAQKIILLSQGLANKPMKGHSYHKSLQSLKRLGYVQIDTISVVQRAHHHVLWSRNSLYQVNHLDRMVEDKHAFEYWSHAASYLDMENFRFSLPRKQALKSGTQQHWFKKDPQQMRYVLDRIRAEGPLMAKDFDSNVNKRTGWEAKPTKQALENLFMQGDLMIAKRQGFHKVYDLTERVLPEQVSNQLPSPAEHAEFLILAYLRAQGIGQPNEFSYLLKGVKQEVELALKRLSYERKITKVIIAGEPYYTTTEALSLLDLRISRQFAKILSPFDNLLIQRERMRKLFNYDYTIECYVPQAKRQFGYFCLPILWQGKLIGRVDCKVHRKVQHLEILQLFIEDSSIQEDDFLSAFEMELAQFAAFNQAKPPSNYPIHFVT
ncbi:winged helix-turn-helix domain-containing protein [Marinomonas epiphytica]